MSAIKYQKWVIKNQPSDGIFELDSSKDNATFELKTLTINPETDLKQDQVLAKTVYLSNDPAQKFWIYSQYKDYGSQVPKGETVPSLGLAKVVLSKSDEYKPGDYIIGYVKWSEYSVLDAKHPSTYKVRTDLFPVDKIPLENHVSILGLTGLTAYCGLFSIGGLKEAKEDEGKVYFVTGAAGGVGMAVLQLAVNILKAKKVFAIAGGEEKRKLVETVGDCVVGIDYKDPNFKQNLDKAIGDEQVDVFFDNVGGEIFELAAQRMRVQGKIISCGSISSYDSKKQRVPFWGLPLVVTKRLFIKGFIFSDHFPEVPGYMKAMAGYVATGKIKSYTTIVDNKGDKFKDVPHTWWGLYEGSNKGKLLTQVGDA